MAGRRKAPPAPTTIDFRESQTTSPLPSPSERRGSRKERLGELKELLDETLITQDEYDTRRREILAEV